MRGDEFMARNGLFVFIVLIQQLMWELKGT